MPKDVVVHRGAQACVNRRDREGGTVVEKKRVGEGGGGKERRIKATQFSLFLTYVIIIRSVYFHNLTISQSPILSIPIWLILTWSTSHFVNSHLINFPLCG